MTPERVRELLHDDEARAVEVVLRELVKLGATDGADDGLTHLLERLAEARAEVEQLRGENAAMCSEIERLRGEIRLVTSSPESFGAVIAALWAEVERLQDDLLLMVSDGKATRLGGAVTIQQAMAALEAVRQERDAALAERNAARAEVGRLREQLREATLVRPDIRATRFGKSSERNQT